MVQRALPALVVLFVLVSALAAGPLRGAGDWQPRVGDVVFHTSTSAQSLAIQKATASKWSHVGMVVRDADAWKVIEAVQPVRIVDLKSFLDRGEEGHYAVYRGTGPIDGPAIATAARTHLGTDYDPYFQWSDARIYCSELVWKAYAAAGIRLSEPRSVSEFDLSAPAVQKLIAERFPGGMPPDVAVSPQDLADSKLLEKIAER